MSPSSRAGGFEGDLEALSVVELVQTLSLGGKTARLLMRSESRHGEMWFRDGVMTHAAAGRLFGDLAVYAMIEWTAGQFLVEYGLTTDARSITQDTTFLVLEGLRRIDERSADHAPSADRVEVPPVLEADVRREYSRRIALGVIFAGLVAGAVVTAIVRDWNAPSTTDVEAAVVPAAPADVRPVRPVPAKPSARRPSPKQKAVEPPPPAVAAPESAAAEESVPVAAPVEAPPAIEEPAAPVVATVQPARLVVSGKSGADGGTLTVLVDGAPAFTHERLGKSEPFGAEIALAPGEHVIVARLVDGAKAGVYEDQARSVFAGGESRSLRITANRSIGSPVKVKLGRPDSQE